MLQRFFPDCHVASVHGIDYEKLKSTGITALIFDIDNTLVPHNVPEPTDEIIALFNQLRTLGFRVCLLSNNREARVAAFNVALNFPNVSAARKPSRKGVKQALALLDAAPKQCAIIGDQVFTDVWAGRRAGILPILVEPVSHRDEFTVRLKRGVEKLVINAYKKRAKEGN